MDKPNLIRGLIQFQGKKLLFEIKPFLQIL